MTPMQTMMWNHAPELVMVVIMFSVVISLDMNWIQDEKRNRK